MLREFAPTQSFMPRASVTLAPSDHTDCAPTTTDATSAVLTTTSNTLLRQSLRGSDLFAIAVVLLLLQFSLEMLFLSKINFP